MHHLCTRKRMTLSVKSDIQVDRSLVVKADVFLLLKKNPSSTPVIKSLRA